MNRPFVRQACAVTMMNKFNLSNFILEADMLDGDISIHPYKNKDKNSCTFCNYSGICQFDSSLKDNRYKIINKKSDDEVIRMMKGEIK